MAVSTPAWTLYVAAPNVRTGSVGSYGDIGRQLNLTFDKVNFFVTPDVNSFQNVVALNPAGISASFVGAPTITNVTTASQAGTGSIALPLSASGFLYVAVNGVTYKMPLFPV